MGDPFDDATEQSLQPCLLVHPPLYLPLEVNPSPMLTQTN